MSRRTLVILGVAALVVAGAVLAVARRGTAPVEVDVGAIARVETLESYVSASGEITAVRSADIGSSVMGRLVSLQVREGARVKAGQVLALIDQEQAASAVAAASAGTQALEADARGASARVRAAQADLDAALARADETARTLVRARDLHREGLAPQNELDAATAAADAAKAAVAEATAALRQAEQAVAGAERRIAQGRADERRARDGLTKTRIESPIDGVVTRLEVEEGEMVVMGVQNQPGTILMTVSDLSAIEAEIKVAEADVLRLSIDDPATVVLEALPGERFSGRVVEIGASALPQVGAQAAAREFRTLVRLASGADRLRPGLTCDVEILVDERRNVLVAPLQAVVERTGAGGERRTGVFAVRDGAAIFIPLTRTGIIGGLEIEVEGVKEGTPIVVGPIQTLRTLADGDRIRAAR
jgi:HlyD family secretion protein